MKSNKRKKVDTTSEKISSVDVFWKSYFPDLTAKQKKNAKEEKNFGTAIAMSILDGINRDLNSTTK